MSSFKKATRREIYKFLHVFSMGVLIINMSMLGVFFVGHNVKAVVCQEGDADGDSVCDSYDNCPSISNMGQEDVDGDGIGDACDLCNDSDGDGYGVGDECLGGDCNDSNPDLNVSCEDNDNVPNPELTQSCGLDMVLVIDSSSSMYGNPLQQEKDAFLGFVDSFLPETPARIAVVDFNTTATLLQGFTASTTLLENAINSVTTTENTFGSDIKYTNWHDALVKAHAEYSNGRPEAPDLIVFASDGNPNKYNNPAEPTFGKDETTALAKAVDEANAVKSDGIRIIALGIGDDVSEDNLTSISGPIVAPPAAVNKDADVILTDFSTLADDLANYATELCGGTVTVKKYVNDVLTGGWDFTAYFNSDTDTGTTDSNGMTNLDIAIDDGSVSVDVEEAVKPDYILDNAFCTINDEPVGTFDNTDSVDNILVSKSDVVYCEFYNIDKPQTGSLTMCKQEDLNGNGLLDSGEPTVTDPLWHFMIEGMDDDFVATTTGCVTVDNLPYGDYNAFEEQAIGWTPTGRIGSSTGNGIFTDHDKISVTIGESNNMPIIYFLNQRTEEPTGSISGCKYRDISLLEEGGLSGKLGGWEITLAQCENNNYNDCDIIATTSTGLIAGEGFGCYEFTGLDAGYYQVREIMQDNWTQTYPVSRYYQTYYNIQLTAGEDMGSKDFANYHEPYCGDGVCDSEMEECCESCPQDCGSCGGGGPVCGNGIVESGEACDDGNQENGDGCDQHCAEEGGPSYFTYTNQGSGATPPSQSTPSVKGEEGAPNLTISKAVAQTTANAGDKNISYKIVVANNGNLTAFDVVVKDTLPEGMTYASDGSTGKTWEIGDLAPGDSKDIMYLANIGEDVDPVVLTNTATVSASNFGEVSDSAEVTVKEIKVLAETGFSLSEFVLLLLALSASFGSAFYLRKKYLKA